MLFFLPYYKEEMPKVAPRSAASKADAGLSQ
jgi:hypothetical protein